MDTYADDLAELIESLGLHEAVLVGHSTGGVEITRYLGRHGTSRVAKTVLLVAVPPLMLRTDANPEGLPIDTFDNIRIGVATDRSQFYKDLSVPFYGGMSATPSQHRGRILFETALANLQPGHQGAWVDYHNDARAPLLFIAGSEDHLMPAKIQWSNAKHYKSDTITEVAEFSGKAHLLPAQNGWEEIADYALAWAVRHARTPAAPQGSTMA